MKVTSLLEQRPNRFQIAERELTLSTQKKPMNKFSQTLEEIADSPPTLFAIGTVIGFLGVAIFGGFKVACLVLAIWAFLFMVGYAIKKFG